MKSDITEQQFIKILDEAKGYFVAQKKLKLIGSGDEFEAMLFNVIQEICAKEKIVGCYQTGKQTFPDIIIGNYGVEAKFTSGDTWISTGNSIVETTRVDGIQKIYMFFMKQARTGVVDARFKPYQDCLSDIVVTHSPRYRINMDLDPSQSIFKKMDISYDEFCEEDSIKLAKEYYRGILKKGEELWWIDAKEDAGVTPIIKSYSDLDASKQDDFKVETFSYFPELLSPSIKKYVKPALHLMQKYQATCSSLRDLFTAGGQAEVKISTGRKVKMPKIYHHLQTLADRIKVKINQTDMVSLSKIWGVEVGPKSDAVAVWLELIDEYAEPGQPKPSEVFRAGLS